MDYTFTIIGNSEVYSLSFGIFTATYFNIYQILNGFINNYITD